MTWSCDWIAADTETAGAAPAERWTPGELNVPERRSDAEPVDGTALQDALLADAVRSAYEEGHAAGLAEGRTTERDRVEETLAALETVLLELEAVREPWVRNAETQLTALATAIARHIVEREVRADASLIADLVRRALAEFPLDEPVRIRLHPQSLSALGERKLAPGRPVQWQADATLAPGGCVVEGPKRVVDGRVEHVLERIFRALSSD